MANIHTSNICVAHMNTTHKITPPKSSKHIMSTSLSEIHFSVLPPFIPCLIFINNGHFHFFRVVLSLHSLHQKNPQKPHLQSIQKLPDSSLHFSPFLIIFKNLDPQFIDKLSATNIRRWGVHRFFPHRIGPGSWKSWRFIRTPSGESQSIDMQTVEGSKNWRNRFRELPEGQKNTRFYTHEIDIA